MKRAGQREMEICIGGGSACVLTGSCAFAFMGVCLCARVCACLCSSCLIVACVCVYYVSDSQSNSLPELDSLKKTFDRSTSNSLASQHPHLRPHCI